MSCLESSVSVAQEHGHRAVRTGRCALHRHNHVELTVSVQIRCYYRTDGLAGGKHRRRKFWPRYRSGQLRSRRERRCRKQDNIDDSC